MDLQNIPAIYPDTAGQAPTPQPQQPAAAQAAPAAAAPQAAPAAVH